MPKKTRKMKQRAAERRGMMQTGMPESAEMSSTESAGGSAPRARADFGASRVVSPITFDYSYIYSDLKRIAVFAVFFFAVLIALSFVIK
ncbi:MAG TPA: hypothetical protein VF429_05140 [Anaerolineae bacterium]